MSSSKYSPEFQDGLIRFFNSQGVRFVDQNGKEIKSVKETTNESKN